MYSGIDKKELHLKVLELIEQQHKKMDGVTVSPDLKAKSEGFIEALYQVESLIVNWGKIDLA